ncbi:MAG: phosphatase PAP2 family protein [Rhodospirillales bacterium]|nr:phosphatase PAP2 family protein [Rhodospirillales bacterium]
MKQWINAQMNQGANAAVFLSRNWLASCTAVIAFAISEFLVLKGILPLVLHPGQVLAMEGLAILAMCSSPRLEGNGQRLMLTLLCTVSLILLIETMEATGWKGVSQGFSTLFLCGFCFWIINQRVRHWGYSYQLICSSLVTIGCLFVGAIIAWSLLDKAVTFLPKVYDPVLFRLDNKLYLNVFYRLAIILKNHPNLYQIVLILYKYNLVFVIPAIFSEVFYSHKKIVTLPLELLISSFLVFPFFCMVPALAPAFFFGSNFPSSLPNPNALPLHAVDTATLSIRNTFPSLHASWAILSVLALRDSPGWHRLIAIIYMLIIFIATLGFGEHYAIDWLGAMPLVLAVRALASLPRDMAEWGPPLIGGGLLLLAWVFSIQNAEFLLDWPPGVWCLAGASLMLPLWLEARLAKAERKTC